MSGWEIDLHELVAALLEIDAGHDSKVDGSPQVDQIGVCLVLDIHLPVFFILRFLFRTVIRPVFFLVIASFSKNLSLELLVSFLVFLPLRIELEDVQPILDLDFVVKTSTMRDLICLFHQIQFILDRWIVLESIFSHLEQDFDHVLDTLIDVGLVKDMPELVKHGKRNRTAHFLQVLSHFSCQSHGYLNAVIGRFVKEEQENLGCKHFVRDLLIAEMRNERRRRNADGFVVSFKSLAELHDQSLQ